MDRPENEKEFLMLYFDDQANLQTWVRGSWLCGEQPVTFITRTARGLRPEHTATSAAVLPMEAATTWLLAINCRAWWAIF